MAQIAITETGFTANGYITSNGTYSADPAETDLGTYKNDTKTFTLTSKATEGISVTGAADYNFVLEDGVGAYTIAGLAAGKVTVNTTSKVTVNSVDVTGAGSTVTTTDAGVQVVATKETTVGDTNNTNKVKTSAGTVVVDDNGAISTTTAGTYVVTTGKAKIGTAVVQKDASGGDATAVLSASGTTVSGNGAKVGKSDANYVALADANSSALYNTDGNIQVTAGTAKPVADKEVSFTDGKKAFTVNATETAAEVASDGTVTAKASTVVKQGDNQITLSVANLAATVANGAITYEGATVTGQVTAAATSVKATKAGAKLTSGSNVVTLNNTTQEVVVVKDGAFKVNGADVTGDVTVADNGAVTANADGAKVGTLTLAKEAAVTVTAGQQPGAASTYTVNGKAVSGTASVAKDGTVTADADGVKVNNTITLAKDAKAKVATDKVTVNGTKIDGTVSVASDGTITATGANDATVGDLKLKKGAVAKVADDGTVSVNGVTVTGKAEATVDGSDTKVTAGEGGAKLGSITLASGRAADIDDKGTVSVLSADGKKGTVPSSLAASVDANGAVVVSNADFGNLGNEDQYLNISGKNNSITSGRGDDSITIANGAGTSLNAGDGDNEIKVEGSSASITSGKGDDKVELKGHYDTVATGAGDDKITVDGHDATVDSGAGDDSISVTGTHASITSGDGHDSVVADEAYATINAGAGNNTVKAAANYSQVTVGDGHNEITVGTGATVVGGNGNDNVSGFGKNSSITLGNGRNTVKGSGNNDTVTVGDGASGITVDGAYASITAGNGSDTIEAGKGATITSGDGRDTISAGDDAFITTGAGNKTVTAKDDASIATGAGNDTISAGADAIIVAGDGADSIKAGKNSTITAGAGKDTVLADTTGTVFTDYALGTDKIQMASSDALGATAFDTDGKITAGGNDITISSLSGGYYAVQLTQPGTGDADDTVTSYAWAGEGAAQIDGSEGTTGFHIFGNTNTEGDGIIGTKYADTVTAGDNDSIVAGKGKDSVNVNDADGVWVGMYAGDGNETITQAKAGFDDEDTTFVISTTDGLKFTSTGNAATVSIKGASFAISDSELESDNAKLKVNLNGTTYNTQVIKGEKTLDDDTQVVFGSKDSKYNTLDITNGDGTTIDLSNKKQLGDTRVYDNIQVVNASADSGDNVLMGGEKAVTLMGGTGASSLWGGSGTGDLLMAGSGDDTFFYGAGDGKDTVTGYESDSDKLYLTDSALQNVTRSKDGGLVLKYAAVDNKTQKLTVQNGEKTQSADDTYVITTTGEDQWIAKVGLSDAANNFTFDDDTNFYVGGTKDDTLTVADDGSYANIWLNNYGFGGQKAYSGIKTVNAGAASDDVTLVGADDQDNVLVASKGASSLWGGAGSKGDDLLDGSTTGRDADTFFFGKGNGKDTIKGAGEDDRVMLYDVTLDDIDFEKSKTGTDLKLALKDGSSVTLTGINGTTNLVLSDGSTYTYNAKSKSFE